MSLFFIIFLCYVVFSKSGIVGLIKEFISLSLWLKTIIITALLLILVWAIIILSFYPKVIDLTIDKIILFSIIPAITYYLLGLISNLLLLRNEESTFDKKIIKSSVVTVFELIIFGVLGFYLIKTFEIFLISTFALLIYRILIGAVSIYFKNKRKAIKKPTP